MSVDRVYLIWAVGTMEFKIGIACNPTQRCKQLQLKRREELVLIAHCKGTYEIERRLHGRLSKFALGGEWFVLPSDVATEIRALIERGRIKKRNNKPPALKAYYWRNDSAGFELRRSRDDDYVARLSGREWQKMKRNFKGRALTAEVRKWSNQKIAKKYGREQ